jgi:signal transduction histidine kinase
VIRAVIIAVASVLVGGAASAVALRRVRAIKGQLLLLGIGAALLSAAAVVIAGLVMFSTHDLIALVVLAAASAGTSAALAGFLAARIAARVSRFHDAAAELADGNLTVRIPEEGPEELRGLAVSFNAMAAGLARLFETRRNLVAWASHDLRAPLAALQAMIEALEDGVGEPDRYLPEMRTQVRTLSMLVDDLFELSRIETGTLTLALIDVSLAELAAQCVRSLRPTAERRGVRLAIENDQTSARARCDPDKLERVMLNLLTNALRHTPQDGSIAVRVVADGDAVQVAVEDTGRGIAPDAIDRVFESFWRADPSRGQATGGAGLGLAIARGLVEAHGGRIWAENRPEGGARFSFTVPAASART